MLMAGIRAVFPLKMAVESVLIFIVPGMILVVVKDKLMGVRSPV